MKKLSLEEIAVESLDEAEKGMVPRIAAMEVDCRLLTDLVNKPGSRPTQETKDKQANTCRAVETNKVQLAHIRKVRQEIQNKEYII